MLSRPFQLFVGSSGEGKTIAMALVNALRAENHYFSVLPWWDMFPSNDSFFDSLIASSRAVDFGIFVATPDDVRVMRGDTGRMARDNVLFEFALFCGQLGKKRVVLVQCKESDGLPLDLPTDLNGITNLRFDSNSETYNDLALRCQSELLRDGAREGGKELLIEIERRIRTRDELGKHVFNCYQQVVKNSLSAPPQVSIKNVLGIFEKAKGKNSVEIELPSSLGEKQSTRHFFEFGNLNPDESKKLSSQLALQIFDAAMVGCKRAKVATRIAIWDGAQNSNKRVLFDAVALSGLPAIVVNIENRQILGRYCRGEKVVLAHDFLNTGFTPIECVRLLRESGLIVNHMVTLCAREAGLGNATSEAKKAGLIFSYCFCISSDGGVRSSSGESLWGQI